MKTLWFNHSLIADKKGVFVRVDNKELNMGTDNQYNYEKE